MPYRRVLPLRSRCNDTVQSGPPGPVDLFSPHGLMFVGPQKLITSLGSSDDGYNSTCHSVVEGPPRPAIVVVALRLSSSSWIAMRAELSVGRQGPLRGWTRIGAAKHFIKWALLWTLPVVRHESKVLRGH